MSAQAAKLLHWFAAPRRWTKSIHPLGLRARVALLVASGLLALFAIFVLLGLSALRDSSDREFAQKVVLAQMAAGQLDSVLQEVAALEEWAAADIAGPLASGSNATLETALAGAAGRLSAVSSGLVLYDTGGGLVAEASADREVADVRLPEAAVEAAQSGAARSFGWARIGEKGYAFVVVPVPGSGGRVLGYLGAPVDLSGHALASWLKQPALGHTTKVDVVDSQGNLLTSASGSGRLGPEGHSVFFGNLVSAGTATATGCFDCHATAGGTSREREVMAFAPLQSVGWGVVLRQSENEVLEPVRVLQQQVLGLGALSLVVALLGVWMTTRGVLAPLQSLTSSARKLADGRLDDAVPSSGGDEIGELGRTLEQMRARLRDSIDEIKRYNVELNERVVERTAELEASRDDLRRSRDEMERLVERLSVLNETATALNALVDQQTILAAALADAMRLASADSGVIYLAAEGNGPFAPAAYNGISREAAAAGGGLGVFTAAGETGMRGAEPCVVADTTAHTSSSRSPALRQQMRFLVRVPFGAGDRLLGTICLGSPTAREVARSELDLLSSLGHQVAVALEKARLYEELQRKEMLRGELLQKVISAQEEERKRIARELHDETSQALAALAVSVETAGRQCAEGEDVSASLLRMKTLALGTLEEVHRLVFELRPTMLDDLGLIAALRWYADSRLGEAGVKVTLETIGEERRLDPLVETTLYRVVQEAVNNVANHSSALSFRVTLDLERDKLSLSMTDDGRGFDPGEFAHSSGGKRGLGLMGMKERVELLGGRLDVRSELGQGTTITVVVPLEGQDEANG